MLRGFRIFAGVGMSLALAACVPDATTEPDPPRITLTTGPTEQRVAQGAATVFTMTISRQSFTGPVVLSADASALPTGVSVTFDPATLQPGETQATARVDVSPTAPVQYVAEPPLVTIPVAATGPNGLTTSSALRVRLVPSNLAGITLNATPAELTITFGESAEGLVTIARQGNYSGPTTLELFPTTIGNVTPGAALDYTLTPVAGVPDTWRMRFSAANPAKAEELFRAAALIAALPFTLRATPQGLAPVSIGVKVNVTIHTFAVTNASTSIEAGSQGTTRLFLQKSFRFTAPITMSIDSGPPGITGTFSPNPAPDDVVDLTLSVAANVVPGDYVVRVLAKPPTTAGAYETQSRVTITVKPFIPYAIAVSDLSVVAGANVSGPITLTRKNGFAGPVQVTFSRVLGQPLPAGMTVTMTPSSLTQSTGTVLVQTTSATPVGVHQIEATGKTAGFEDVWQLFNVTVTAPQAPVSTVARIEIEPKNAEITAPATQQYTATLYNAAGARMQIEAGGAIRYSTSVSTIARIDTSSGLATGANAGVTTITARYLLNGVVIQSDATPLTVYATNSAGHYGSAAISTNNNNTRTLRPGETLLFQLIVRNVNGTQVTSGVTPTPTVSASNGVTITPCTVGMAQCPTISGYFFTMTAPANATAGTSVKVRYDVMGAGGEITMVITP